MNATPLHCFHCDAPVVGAPVRANIDGEVRDFCCNGCATAARWIRDANLDAYYQLRTAPAPRIDMAEADLGVWDREEVQREHACDVREGRQMTILTDGMHCAACAWLIDRALMREPGVLALPLPAAISARAGVLPPVVSPSTVMSPALVRLIEALAPVTLSAVP